MGMSRYDPDWRKLDRLATDGLAGTSNSLSYRVHEVERHLHNREWWFGAAASASGETHTADLMVGSISAFTLTAGNDTFGSWVQLLGSADTPVQSGSVSLDSHRVLVSATNSTNPYIVQIIAGESADFATKLTAMEYTNWPYISGTNNNDSGIVDIITRRIPATTKVWARTACIGSNGSTISLYFGIHEYEG